VREKKHSKRGEKETLAAELAAMASSTYYTLSFISI